MSNIQSFEDDIERKLDTIWKFITWVIAFLISLAVCLPGIFISLQYSKDDCVQGTGEINIALDWWLFIACSFVISYMIIIMIFICCNSKSKAIFVFWIIIHLIQVCWYTIGIYLIVNSTIKCKHNSLWQMAVAYCAIMGSAWIIETILIILFKCGCGISNCFNGCIPNNFTNQQNYESYVYTPVYTLPPPQLPPLTSPIQYHSPTTRNENNNTTRNDVTLIYEDSISP